MNIKQLFLALLTSVPFGMLNGMQVENNDFYLELYREIFDNMAVVTANQFRVAAYKDNMQTIINFLGAGNDVNAADESGTTALQNAAHQMNKEVIEILVNNPNIRVNEQGMFGYAAIHWACINADAEILVLLLNHPNINLNLVDDNGNTALHLAAARGYAAVASELLASGARADIQNEAGLTALQVAQQRRKQEVVNVINAFTESAAAVQNNAPAQNAVAQQPAPVVDEEETLCAICLDEVVEGGVNTTLTCNHTYHADCIAAHMALRAPNALCPLCNALAVVRIPVVNQPEQVIQPDLNARGIFVF